jgi:hypothetical protein
MKKLIISLALVGVVAGITYLITSWSVKTKTEVAAEFKTKLLAAKIEFLKNNSILRPLLDPEGRPDLKKYHREVNALAAWYYKNPIAELWKAYPKENDPEALIRMNRKRAEEEGSQQRAAKANLPIREEYYTLAKAVRDQLISGNYTVAASDYQNLVRLDVRSVKKDGNQLRWDILVWGGMGQVTYQGWQMKSYKAPTNEEKADYEKALAQAKKAKKSVDEYPADPATLPYTESRSSSGQPVLPDFEASEFIRDFPPRVRLNYFFTPTCPPEAERVKMVFLLKNHFISSGDEQSLAFEFELPVDNEWKGSWEGVRKIEAGPKY